MKYTDTSETGFEALIIQYLCLVNGVDERHFDQYNRSKCVDEELLFQFLEGTQSKEVSKLKQSHGTNFTQHILYLINRKIKDETDVNEKYLGGSINLDHSDESEPPIRQSEPVVKWHTIV